MNQEALKHPHEPKPARETIYLFLAGTGAVGGTLLKQISTLESSPAFKMLGSCNTQRYIIKQNGFPPEETLQKLEGGEKTRWDIILQKLELYHNRTVLFIDATGSEEVARLYPRLMDAGFHIATPSKLANTIEQSYYDILKQKIRHNKTSFRFETTVGAGLPVISTINDLLQSGDRITEISGVVSGTMTYLFNRLENGTPFSEAIITARELGYAEPDPRDDLSGEDVARKFLTMARETGLRVERKELQVETLIPEELTRTNRETFLKRLPEVDDYWQNKMDRARKSGDTLRYTGKFKNNKISIGVEAVPLNSPLGNLTGTDNLFQIFTRRYNQTPIIIQGPGAGKEVTAAGVLADILKIVKEIC